MKPTREEVLRLMRQACGGILTQVAEDPRFGYEIKVEELQTFAALLQAQNNSDHVAVQLAGPESSLTDECQTAFEKAMEGDTFRDAEEHLVASDYFAEGWKSGISSTSSRPNEQSAVQTEHPSLSDEKIVQEAGMWGCLNGKIFEFTKREILGLVRALLSAQRQDSNKDAERYRLIRSILHMSVKQQNAITEAMDILPDDDGIPTIEQFDAVVDAGIAFIANGAPK